ncbi:hypothetical protein [Streptomyces sp. NPDC001816]|uniref:hypothetical protein n=1 Tax=Streptomyces sp. NPDC001816 TaxID=3364612 RepID=UPI0036CA1ABF
MNTGEHTGVWGHAQVADEQVEHSWARAELHKRLSDGLARSRLNKSQLAARVQLGRTTVSEAFNPNAPVPSAETVSALVHVLKLPVDELLELRRSAVQEVNSPAMSGPVPGRSISMWEPHDLEVHPAGPISDGRGSRSPERRVLPAYVLREHDRVLADAVRDCTEGRSRMLVLVGSSSTGKTRACWEAVQPLAERSWRLWHPFDPTRAEAALEDLHRVQPRTVVWLNEAQHYLGDPKVGEQIAAAVHALLTQPERGPVLVLGTLWPEYASQYTSLPAPGTPDPHSRVRELLTSRTVSVPEAFDGPALAAADALAADGDWLLADALARTRTNGRLPQDLAGAPELVHRYEHGTPAARAVLEAAMDARRLGVGIHLQQAFLTDAAIDYLTDSDYDQLANDWAEAAFAELAHLVHGKQAPLHRVSPRPKRRPPGPSLPSTGPLTAQGPVFRLADYLEQRGRKTRRLLCPPASFWHAAHRHLTHPKDLDSLAQAAETRHRLQWAHYLRLRAAEAGSSIALVRLGMLWEAAGSLERAETLYQQAADAGDSEGLVHLAVLREMGGDGEAAEALVQQAADADYPEGLVRLSLMREEAGERETAEALARQASDAGNDAALLMLAVAREVAGEPETAEALALQAAKAGDPDILLRLAVMREEAGDGEAAEALAGQAAKAGDPDGLVRLAKLRWESGDREGAEALYREAHKAGYTDALIDLAVLRAEAGDVEILARKAASTGNTDALITLADKRMKAGDREGAEALYRQAADSGSPSALIRLALIREEAGDGEAVGALIQQLADAGATDALLHPAWMSRTAEQQLLPRQRWPYGLDADGTPTAPWDPFTTQ